MKCGGLFLGIFFLIQSCHLVANEVPANLSQLGGNKISAQLSGGIRCKVHLLKRSAKMVPFWGPISD